MQRYKDRSLGNLISCIIILFHINLYDILIFISFSPFLSLFHFLQG